MWMNATCVGCPQEPEEAIGSPGSCELPNMGAQNQTVSSGSAASALNA